MRHLYFSLLVLSGCSFPITPPNGMVDGNDAGSNQDSGFSPHTYDLPSFQSDGGSTCELRIGRSQRVSERWCQNIDGSYYLNDYYDNQLSIRCRFNIAADGLKRCLPENDQSSPIYTDANCSIPIAMVELKSDHTIASPYIGLERFDGDGGMSLVMYSLGGRWISGPAYFKSQWGEDWYCNGVSEFVPLPGFLLYYVGKEVNPEIFAAQ